MNGVRAVKKLPIGYASLSEVINGGCVYIDKTKYVAKNKPIYIDARKIIILCK